VRGLLGGAEQVGNPHNIVMSTGASASGQEAEGGWGCAGVALLPEKKGVTDRAHGRCARPRVRFGSAADVATIRRFGAELPKSDFPSTRLHDRQPAAPWLDADQGVSRCVVSISEGCIASL